MIKRYYLSERSIVPLWCHYMKTLPRSKRVQSCLINCWNYHKTEKIFLQPYESLKPIRGEGGGGGLHGLNRSLTCCKITKLSEKKINFFTDYKSEKKNKWRSRWRLDFVIDSIDMWYQFDLLFLNNYLNLLVM